MFCYCNKQLLLALELVLFEFNTNKKCQVSLVVKYINGTGHMAKMAVMLMYGKSLQKSSPKELIVI